jgi:predicted RNA-binding Zn ribbon-like protein
LNFMVLYKLYVFYANRKSKMATTAGHRLTLDPMGNVQMPSSQKLQIWLKPNCTWMFIGRSSTILRFF